MKQKIAMFNADSVSKPFVEMLELAKSFGFSGMELFDLADLKTPDVEAAKHIRDKAAELDMDICCMSFGADLMAQDLDAQMEQTKGYIRVAEAAGAPYMHFTTFPVLRHDIRGVDMNKMVRAIAPAVRELCDYAAERNIGCVIEGQGFYMNGVEPLAQLISEVDHPNLGIVADLGNTLCVDVKPETFVGYFAPVIRHVHIKDMVYTAEREDTPGVRWLSSRSGAWLRRTELGTGIVDIKRCLRILAAVGYDGYYAIENTVLNRLDKVPKDREYLSELLSGQ